MRQLLILPLAMSLIAVVGCRQKSTVATPPEPSLVEAVPAVPGTPVPGGGPAVLSSPAPVSAPGVDRIEDRLPSAPPGASKSNPVNLKLTEALQRYNEANGKMPPDFNALVTGKYLSQLPQPPAGKRFAVDRPFMQVVVIGP